MTPELFIRRQICSWLKAHHPEIFFFVIDRVGIYNVKRQAFMSNKDPHRIKGVSDILGVMPGGRMLAIEVKTEKGRVSPEQKFFLETVNLLGGLGFVARSIEDVKKGLNTGIKNV